MALASKPLDMSRSQRENDLFVETKMGNLLEGGEMMLAKMVEERDKDKLELFLQEMDNLDNFLDEAEALLRSSSPVERLEDGGGLADLLQIPDGDLIPMKDIPVIMEMGNTSALQLKKELTEEDQKNWKVSPLKREEYVGN